MNRSNSAACAALGAGLASALPTQAFMATGVGADIDSVLQPSQGSFRTEYAAPDQENAFLVANLTVTRDAPTWRTSLDEIMASSWWAIDRYGPFGADGTALYGTGWYATITGPGGTTHVPEANGVLVSPDGGLAANGQNGDPVNGDGLSPGFFGRHSGFAATANGILAQSAPTLINGTVYQSMFFAHIVLSDPSATLVGDDILFFTPPIAPVRLPLDGSAGTGVGGESTIYRIEQQRTTFTNSLGTFTAIDLYIVPAPASVALAPGMLLLAGRRRRR